MKRQLKNDCAYILKNSGFILILIVLFQSLTVTNLVLATEPATVDTSTTEHAVRFGATRSSFYAAEQFWAFYSDGTNAVYENSTDGTTWTGSVTSIGAVTDGGAYHFSVWFDGVYSHYARYNNNDLFYRRGEPETNGSITWCAAEQTVYDGEPGDEYQFPAISVDTNGYAWIGALFKLPDGFDDFPYVLKNANNDGTWTTDFAYELKSFDETSWKVLPVPLTDGKVYVIYCRSLQGNKPRGKLYDGGWGAEESDLSPDYWIQDGYKFSAVAIGDNVHFIYNRLVTYQIRHNERVWGVGWDADEDVLVQDDVKSDTAPALSVDSSARTLYCFWTSGGIGGTDHVYYKKYDDGEWDTDPTDWIDEHVDDILYDYFINSFYKDYGSYIGLSYVTKEISPFKVRFASLETPLHTPPVPSNIDSNETREGAPCEFSTYWDDAGDDGLDSWTFSWNVSGAYVKDAKVSFAGNPDKGWSNVTKLLPAFPQTIKWKIYANDTLGNQAVTAEQLLVVTIGWTANVTKPDGDLTDDETVDDFEWGSSWGDSAFWYTDNPWVFEGKRRYSFQLDYQKVKLGTVKQFGLRFTDNMDQNHTIWYDKDANTLTVTSPYDGISGWVNSFTQTGTKVTVIFQIMFNTPIPDSYGVQLQVRVVADADSGWLTPSGGIFNIYNLGGLSTLYSSGTAGRMPGGDIFEIYAADTRTRNIIPTQDFDVRASSLSPGVQIAGVQIVEAEDEQKLLDELVGWKIWMTSRTEARTIYPTNRLPATAANDDLSYVSYPFGLLIKSDSTLDQSLMIEKEFFRTIETADGEIVTAEFWGTVANDTKITGQVLISDDGYVDDAIAGTWTPAPSDSKRIVDFKFYGNGSIRLMDGVSNIYPATYSGMVWANYTFVMNLTAQTYDFYVDSILNRSSIAFREAASSVGHITFLDTLNPVFPAQPVEFLVDDVWVHTDFDEPFGGAAEGTMLFDKNQHWSMDFDFFVEDGSIHAQGASGTPRRVDDDYSDYGYLEFGWDLMINKTMVHDFLVARVNITDGHISGKNDWIQFNITWYQRGVYVKNDLLYGLFEGYSLFPGDSKDTCGFHWDIWFNRANASTVVGARINPEYYGMSDKAVWWAIWSSKWTAMRSEVSESTLFIDLEDANGVIHSAQEVSFVRSWVKVLRDTRGQFAYKVLNIAGLDFPIARDTMSGIDTPPIRETLVPEVASGWFGSFIGGIFTAALRRLGNLLAGFGMGLFSLSVDFIDNVFAALGYPGLVATIFGWMDSLFATVPTLLGYGLTLVGQVYRLINTSAGNTLTQITSVITIWVNMYSIMMELLTGVLTPGINLWRDLGVNNFIMIGAIIYPMWLLAMYEAKGMQAVIDHLNGILNIGSFFLNFVLNVAGFFVSLLTGLIGAIRG